MVPMHAKKRKGALHEPWLVWSSGFRRLGGLGPAEVGSCQFEPFRGAMHPIIRLMRGLNQGEFKNRHKSRSRRGNEAELFFAPKSASSRRRLPSLNTPWVGSPRDDFHLPSSIFRPLFSRGAATTG